MSPRAPARAGIAALLFALTLALHWRTGDFAFLNYDDDAYVTANEGVRGGLSAAGLRWAFTSTHAANWHPLTWLSHQLDVELFGLDPRGHHRTNALLHALAAALCFLALHALSAAPLRSALAAAFFALHPLRVESVAWVAERKDLLAGVLAFAVLWAYAGFARRGGTARYTLCFALFALGLMAKPMLVTLPCLLLVLDGWPLARLSFGESSRPALTLETGRPGEAKKSPPGETTCAVLREKVPLLLLAAASALATLLVQRAGGALEPLAEVPFGPRVVNALRSLGLYLAKSFVPSGLCAFHPHPFFGGAGPGVGITAGLGLVAVGAWLWVGFVRRRSAPYLLVGALWFLGLLVPVLGLVQVGLQGWAERYTYLPSVGLALAVVWGGAALARGPGARRLALALAAVALLFLARASWLQASTWRDSRTLFEHALRVEESAVAHTNLGRAFLEARDLAAAERHHERAGALAPRSAGPRVNLAQVLALQGRPAEAERELARALQLEPDLAQAHAQLGWLLVEDGREAEALPHLRRAHALAPRDLPIANNLAWVLATSPDAPDPSAALALAEQLLAEARGVQPAYLETLAAALARLGRFEEAVQWQTRALEHVRGTARAGIEQRLALYRAGQPYLYRR